MKDEVDKAAGFLVSLFANNDVPQVIVAKFKQCLSGRMSKKYQRHWHPLKPTLGSAFRAIVIDRVSLDPLIIATLKDVSVDSEVMGKILGKFPKELVLWVDPGWVCYKIGEHGSIGDVYKQDAIKDTSDYESGVSSAEGSPTSSPCSSPPSQAYRHQQQYQVQHQQQYQQQRRQQKQQVAHSIQRQCGRDAWQANSYAFPNQLYQYQSTTVA